MTSTGKIYVAYDRVVLYTLLYVKQLLLRTIEIV